MKKTEPEVTSCLFQIVGEEAFLLEKSNGFVCHNFRRNLLCICVDFTL